MSEVNFGEVLYWVLAVVFFAAWIFVMCLPFLDMGTSPYDDRFDDEFYREREEADNRKKKP